MITSLQSGAEVNPSQAEFKDKKNKEAGIEKHFIPPSEISTSPQTELKKRRVKHVKSTSTSVLTSTQIPRQKKEDSALKKKKSEIVTWREALQDSIEVNDSPCLIKEKDIQAIHSLSTTSITTEKKHQVTHLNSLQTPRQKEKGVLKKKKREKVALEVLQNPVATIDVSLPIKEKEIKDISSTSNPSSKTIKRHQIKHLNSLQTPRQKKEGNLEKKREKEKLDLEVAPDSISESDSHGNHQGIRVDTSTIISSSKILKEEKSECHSRTNQDSISIAKSELSYVQIKALLANCNSLSRVQYQELLLYIIKMKPPYKILHTLCEKKETEEHIEFLFDYVQWSQIDHQIELKSYKKELKAMVKKYIKGDSKRAINIDHKSRMEVIESFNKKNYIQVEASTKAIALNIVSLLWNNVFHEVFPEPIIQNQILDSIQ